MATFYKGFVYETGISGGLMIEGVPPSVKANDAESVDHFAKRYIDNVLRPGRDKARAAHLAILKKGVGAWNRWRRKRTAVRPTLADADLRSFKNLNDCDFSHTNLCGAKMSRVHLRGASFHQAILARANLSYAHLEGANFCRTDLYETNLTGAWLTGANLQGVQLAKTKLARAHLRGCTVYGLSAWDLRDAPAEQDQLRIRYTAATEGHEVEREVEVDGLDLASFMYLTLNNRNISRIIDAASKKWVLLLGTSQYGRTSSRISSRS